MPKPRRASKGLFSDASLPVARRYLYPPRRRTLLWGGLGAAAVVAVAAIDFGWGDAHLLSNGPLSSAHATLDADCGACHEPFGEVTADACATCHEKFGDALGVFSFASHYLYRSNDFQRLGEREHETACTGCHLEHLGREAEITRVADGRCLPCHDYGSFNRAHPDFAPASAPDDDALAFTHVHHTREVMVRQGLEDAERACLYCHHPESSGEGFRPLDFDRHCDACHLTATTATPRLPIAGPDAPGVATLAALVEGAEPGTRWASFANPNEYRQVGGRVSKSPVHHSDPWILENLRRLRRELYPDAGLAELLTASPEVPASELRTLYEEAVATLEDHALGLRSRPEPEVQAELEVITRLLAEVRRALEDPYAPLDETEFLLALADVRPDVAPERAGEIEDLVDQLTQPCQPCHAVEKATIARVRADQAALRRAEFDHRAHILQVRCLDCHAEIPIAEGLESAEKPKSGEWERDRAAIQNLPRIAVCRRCHEPDVSSSRCVTCHRFHPDKNRRSDLLLYLTEEEATGQDRVGAGD